MVNISNDGNLTILDSLYVTSGSYAVGYHKWQLFYFDLSSITSTSIRNITIYWTGKVNRTTSADGNIYLWNNSKTNWSLIKNGGFSDNLPINISSSINSTDFINASNYLNYLVYYNGSITGANTLLTDYINITIDYTSIPNATLISPVTGYSSPTRNVSFVLNSTDLIGLKNITLYVWNATNQLNATNSTTITGINNLTTLSLNLSDGNYKWGCQVFNTENNSFWSSNNTLTVASQIPSINLNSPTNNQYLKNGSNIYFNFTATDSHGLSICRLFSNWTGSWIVNYTWNFPNSGLMNYTTQNITNDGNYLWGISCNDTVSVNASSYNYTFILDRVYPNVSINNIATTDGSQTITVTHTEQDRNLATCKYSIYNSSGQIDGILENISITCNSPFSPSVSGFSNYNLYLYSIDYAGNENSTNLTFITTSTPVVLSVGGGGGGGISAVAIKNINNTYSELYRAIIYARMREYCINSSNNCNRIDYDSNIILQSLFQYNINISLEDTKLFLNNFKNNLLESVQLSQSDIETYKLYTGVIQYLDRLIISPGILDPFFSLIIFSNHFEFDVKSNRVLTNVSLIGDSDISYKIINDNEVSIILDIKNTGFSTKIFKGIATYMDKDNNVAYQQINIRVINLKSPITLISIFLVFALGFLIYKGKWIKNLKLG